MKIKQVRFRADRRNAILIDTKYHDEISDVLSFAVPGAHFAPAVKQGLWDGKTRMMTKDGVVSVGLLRAPEIRKVLEEKGLDIRLKKWTNRPVHAARKGWMDTNEKYEYQNECVTAMLKAIPFGGGVILAATGSGKTKIAAQLNSWIDSPCLFVVDQIDLLYQSAKEIEEWLKVPVGIVGNSNYQPSDRVTVATIQTLHKHAQKAVFRRWLKSIKIVIIDELHVQMSRRNFSVVNVIDADAVFGLTATLELKKKPIRMKAFSICGPVIYEFPLEQGSDLGILTKGIGIQINIPNDVVHKPEDTLPLFAGIARRIRKNSDMYDKVVVRNDYTNNVIATFISHALNRGYYCAVLVERVAHLKTLEELFKARGQAPKLLYGAIETSDRKKTIRRLDKGREDLILATKVFTKGTNVKRLDLILDCAQRGNKNDTGQKYGRGVRLHSEKNGLLYFHINTAPEMTKYAKKRQSALKALKIPVFIKKMTTSRDILKFAEKELNKLLSKDK